MITSWVISRRGLKVSLVIDHEIKYNDHRLLKISILLILYP